MNDEPIFPPEIIRYVILDQKVNMLWQTPEWKKEWSNGKAAIIDWTCNEHAQFENQTRFILCSVVYVLATARTHKID